MSQSHDRQEIVRIDCPACAGNGYVANGMEQTACGRCGGVGMLEKSMPYRPEGYSLNEAGQLFGVHNPTNRLLPGDPALDRSPARVDE